MDKNQRKSGVVLSYISIVVNTLIQLLFTPFLIRMLGQSEYGLYSLVSSIIGYLTVLDLGFGNAIIVYTVKYRTQKEYDKEKKLHGMFKAVFVVIGLISAILSLILFFNVNNIFGKTMTTTELHKMKIMLLILAFNLMLTFSFSIYNSIIVAYEKFAFQKIMALLSSLLKPFIMLPLLFVGCKSITLCLVITGINVFIIMSNYLYCRNKLNISAKFLGFDSALFKVIFGYSIWLFLGVIVDKVNWSVDNFILGAVSGTIAVSIYSVAAAINQLFLQLSTAISSVFLPKMSQLESKSVSNEELTNEMIKVGRLQNYIIFLACSGLVLFGRNFILLWVGKSFEEAYRVSLLLVIPASFSLIQNLGLSIMMAKNKYRFKSLSTAIMAVVNLIASIFAAKKFGATGAAFVTGVSLIICHTILINIYYYKKLSLNVIRFWKSIFMQSLPFIIPIVLILTFEYFTNITGLIGFVVYGVSYTVLYCLTAYLFSMNTYEKNIIKKRSR